MKARFYIVTIKSKQIEGSNPVIENSFLSLMSNQLANLIDIQLTKLQRLSLTVKPNAKLPGYADLYAAKVEMDKKKFQLCIELNDNSEIVAIHEGFFALTPFFKLYRIATDQLYFNNNSHANYLYQSLCYGILNELANHNSGDKKTFNRGLALLDYLNMNSIGKLNRIVKKSVDSQLYADHYLKTRSMLPLNVVTRINEEVLYGGMPVINFNDINFDVLQYALEKVGSFVLIGTSIDKFKSLGGFDVLNSSRKLFNLTEGHLYKVYNHDGAGYQDVLLESLGRALVAGKGYVSNTFAYHINPNKLLAPPGFDMNELLNGYNECFALQHTLYRIIAFYYKIDPKNLPAYRSDLRSVLTTNIFFENTDGTIGTPAQSYHNLLTFDYASRAGLEVLKDNKWLRVNKDDVCISLGNCGLFHLKNKNLKAGEHRVIDISKKYYSLSFFLNADKDQKLALSKRKQISHQAYLNGIKH
jgi:hypothetical protein